MKVNLERSWRSVLYEIRRDFVSCYRGFHLVILWIGLQLSELYEQPKLPGLYGWQRDESGLRLFGGTNQTYSPDGSQGYNNGGYQNQNGYNQPGY